MRYMQKYQEAQDEIKSLKSTIKAFEDQSITHFAVKFINAKGLSQEWADFIIKKIEEPKP